MLFDSHCHVFDEKFNDDIELVMDKCRDMRLMFVGFKIAMIVSVIMIIVGVIMLILNSKKGKFEDLYNDKNNKEIMKF